MVVANSGVNSESGNDGLDGIIGDDEEQAPEPKEKKSLSQFLEEYSLILKDGPGIKDTIDADEPLNNGVILAVLASNQGKNTIKNSLIGFLNQEGMWKITASYWAEKTTNSLADQTPETMFSVMHAIGNVHMYTGTKSTKKTIALFSKYQKEGLGTLIPYLADSLKLWEGDAKEFAGLQSALTNDKLIASIKKYLKTDDAFGEHYMKIAFYTQDRKTLKEAASLFGNYRKNLENADAFASSIVANIDDCGPQGTIAYLQRMSQDEVIRTLKSYSSDAATHMHRSLAYKGAAGTAKDVKEMAQTLSQEIVVKTIKAYELSVKHSDSEKHIVLDKITRAAYHTTAALTEDIARFFFNNIDKGVHPGLSHTLDPPIIAEDRAAIMNTLRITYKAQPALQ